MICSTVAACLTSPLIKSIESFNIHIHISSNGFSQSNSRDYWLRISDLSWRERSSLISFTSLKFRDKFYTLPMLSRQANGRAGSMGLKPLLDRGRDH
ncbi:hypothetical protein RRG08_002422 [Elysia crispata]|uniref:Uncharacterized protein n=1 Tax=Elysia crispata TaxID=231223 RepID=A0AAE0ZGN8_9GAST|nr:hypothetical protein RRG08_002422 [Elysia crispata]